MAPSGIRATEWLHGWRIRARVVTGMALDLHRERIDLVVTNNSLHSSAGKSQRLARPSALTSRSGLACGAEVLAWRELECVGLEAEGSVFSAFSAFSHLSSCFLPTAPHTLNSGEALSQAPDLDVN